MNNLDTIIKRLLIILAGIVQVWFILAIAIHNDDVDSVLHWSTIIVMVAPAAGAFALWALYKALRWAFLK